MSDLTRMRKQIETNMSNVVNLLVIFPPMGILVCLGGLPVLVMCWLVVAPISYVFDTSVDTHEKRST